jgi:hypothetical protein
MIRDGILIHEDGAIEILRALPDNGTLVVDGFDADHADLEAAIELWAEACEEHNLPELDPADAPIYKVVQSYEPLTLEEANEYLDEIAEAEDSES